MPVFSFIGHIRAELLGKCENWQQIYKQMNSIFYSSNKVCLKSVLRGKILAVMFLCKSFKAVTAVYFVLKKCVHETMELQY